ncbi:hypothetical protein CMI47_18240 [Candidatus Pacearchaeota archaeon]|jgi:hypothetical protein|nr:hypothetical protein [Candidatus Pacearchaeota archaeon]|tara:strand:+ start:18611 stop:19036 length:426 start_codon:yes stop_codon:yes gene_type:complete
MIELWIRDEYGQASIIDRSDDPSALFRKAMDKLEDENLDNALTAEETEKNWTCYLPVSVDGSGDVILEHLYSGSSSPGRYDFIDLSNGNVSRIPVDSLDLRMLVGKVDGEYISVKDHKRNLVADLNSETLRLKSFLFFKEK